jgi:cellulose synthase operon protein YhjQ
VCCSPARHAKQPLITISGKKKMKSDISNLLGKFGANTSKYLEINDTIKYKESAENPVAVVPAQPSAPAREEKPVAEKLSTPASQATSAVLPVVAKNTVSAENEAKEPFIAALPDVTEQAAASVAAPATATTLRSLLTEAARKREALAQVRNETSALQASLDTEKLSTAAHVIAIVSPKGGVGKTTIAAALAATLKPAGQTIAIDLDPQNSLQYHLGMSPDTAVKAEASQAEASWDKLLREGEHGIRALPYGVIAEAGARALEKHIAQDKQWLARNLASMNLKADDVVIIDTPAGQTSYLQQVLDVADQVVVVVMPDAGSFIALNHIDQMLEGRSDCSYIVNQFDASRTFCQDMREVLTRRFGTKLIGVVSLDHAISEGLAYGVNPLTESGQSPVHREIMAIGAVLSARISSVALTSDAAL